MSKAKTICTVCNYIYDEVLGEPRQEILPSVSFEALAEEWRCPECGSNKEMFQPCSCVSLPIYEKTCVIHSELEMQQTSDNSASLFKNTPVGELVAQHPSYACVLEQHGIDYCCGGKATLEEACGNKGLNVESVLKKFAVVDQNIQVSNELDWTSTSLKLLTEHIIEAYHNPLRLELSRILLLAEKVARVHGGNHPEMIEVLNVFAQFKEELKMHMQKEELILFPSIASLESKNKIQGFGCGGGIEHPIEVMTKEHDSAGEALGSMRRLTNSFTPPEDACTTFKLLLTSLAQLESEMHQHVHKENNILFPRAIALFYSASTKPQEFATTENRPQSSRK